MDFVFVDNCRQPFGNHNCEGTSPLIDTKLKSTEFTSKVFLQFLLSVKRFGALLALHRFTDSLKNNIIKQIIHHSSHMTGYGITITQTHIPINLITISLEFHIF